MTTDVNLKGFDESGFEDVSNSGADEYPIFRTPSTKVADDEHTLKEGQVIVGRFLGTKVMVTKEKKENWTKEKIKIGDKTQELYTNKHFVFEDSQGKKFGLYRSGTLWKLEKLKTTAMGMAKENPLVKLTYVGLVPESDLAQYGVEIETGEAAHVFTIGTKADAVFDVYGKGCINLLGNPMPMYKEDNGLSSLEQDIENFNVANRRVEGGEAQAQLSM